MCNSGTYDGILDAMNSELYHYSLFSVIKSLTDDERKEIAKKIYSYCSYFDNVKIFNEYIEISYNDWKASHSKPSSGSGSVGGGGGDS